MAVSQGAVRREWDDLEATCIKEQRQLSGSDAADSSRKVRTGKLTIGFNYAEVNGDLEKEGFGDEVGRKSERREKPKVGSFDSSVIKSYGERVGSREKDVGSR